jgi:hypothetical protein
MVGSRPNAPRQAPHNWQNAPWLAACFGQQYTWLILRQESSEPPFYFIAFFQLALPNDQCAPSGFSQLSMFRNVPAPISL